jgi:hypothetical protein
MLVVSHIVHNVASLLRTIGNSNSEKISKHVLCLLLKAVNNSSQSKGSVTTLRKIEVEQLSTELENNGVLQMGDTSQVAPPTA